MNFISDGQKNALLERFLRYVQVWTTSDSSRADDGYQPSTDRQFIFASMLKKELEDLGLSDVSVTDKCYVYARLPASKGAKSEPLCLLAHLDTVEECSGQNVKPVLTKKDGDTIISTDGTTLLGADDKAGIAEIMETLAFFKANPAAEHGEIEICFSPDEETGHGMDNVPLNLIKSRQAYTVDGGNCGEIETECFNAFKTEVTFYGVSSHTGTARGKMVNAAVMAANFVASLPRHQAPETTEGFEGFFAPMEISGTIETAKVTVFLRDFTEKGMQERKLLAETLAKTVAQSFGGKVEVKHTFQYANMKEKLKNSPQTVERLVEACRASGIEPVFPPIRGGTDGSKLTEKGIPTPNIFTGGHDFHSRSEWASLNEMCKALEVLIRLCSAQGA